MWPPKRVEGVMARSRLTRAPAFNAPSLLRCSISGERSAEEGSVASSSISPNQAKNSPLKMALLKRTHELRRACRVSGVTPSSGTALKAESPIKCTEDLLHFTRERFERPTIAVPSHHADACCL